jgi:hypothetical protein
MLNIEFIQPDIFRPDTTNGMVLVRKCPKKQSVLFGLQIDSNWLKGY